MVSLAGEECKALGPEAALSWVDVENGPGSSGGTEICSARHLLQWDVSLTVAAQRLQKGMGGRNGTCRLRSQEGKEPHGSALPWGPTSALGATLPRAESVELGQGAPVVSKRVILDSVVGQVSSGQMLALMGPSGAGKSSLLDCISLRNRRFTGRLYLNGRPLREDFYSLSAYVHQEDLFFATLTVREHLTFHARVRVPREAGCVSPEQRVDEVIRAVGLMKCADTLIGGPHSLIRGISGGERKRLSVATELLCDPDIIFADEPTSGLDAFMALSVCKILRDLADKAKVVVCAIHQPSSEIFELFSHLLLLSKGRTAYIGPRANTIPYFASLGYECPKFHNPADYFIEEVVAVTSSNYAETSQRLDSLVTCFEESAIGKQNRAWLVADAEKAKHPSSVISSKKIIKTLSRGLSVLTVRQYRASTWTQLIETYRRTLKSYAREPVLTRIRLVQAVTMGVVLGCVYLQQEKNAIRNKLGAMFLLITNQAIASAFTVAQAIPSDLPVFYREYLTGANRVVSFFLGLTMAEVPYQVVFPCIFGTLTYWLIGLAPSAVCFFRFLLAMVLMANASCSLGYFSSTLTGNDGIAVAIGPAIFLPMSLYVGVLHTASQVPPYFIPLDRISMIKYAFNAMVINELTHESYNQDLSKAVFSYLSLDPGQLWFNYAMLVVLMVGFRLVAYIFLCIRARRLSR